MGLGPAGTPAVGEPAALVTQPDQAVEPGWNRPGGSSHPDGAVIRVGDGELDAGVAGEPAQGVVGQGGSVGDGAGPDSVQEGGEVGVDQDGGPVVVPIGS